VHPVDDVLTLILAPVSSLNFFAINSWNAHGYPVGNLDASGSKFLQTLRTLQAPVSIVAVPDPVFGSWLSSEQA
jgi:hypothetical protein